MFILCSPTSILLKVFFSNHERRTLTDSRHCLYMAPFTASVCKTVNWLYWFLCCTAFCILLYNSTNCHHSRTAIPKFEANNRLERDVITRDNLRQGHRCETLKDRWTNITGHFSKLLRTRIKKSLLSSYNICLPVCPSPHNSATPTGKILAEFHSRDF